MQKNKTSMKQSLLDEFTALVNQYGSKLDPCYEEDAIRSVDAMAEWVEDYRNALECENIEDIFDEFEDMLSYRNGGYREFMFPDGDDEDEYMDNDEENAEGEDTAWIREFRRFCSLG